MQRLSLDRPRLPRNREVQACLQCRNGKLKCDKSKPRCQRCDSRNRDCIYVTKVPRESGSSALTRTAPWPEATNSNAIRGSLLAAERDTLACKSPRRAEQIGRPIWPGQSDLLMSSRGHQLRYYTGSSWTSAVEDLEDSAVHKNSSSRPVARSGPVPSDTPRSKCSHVC
jgi:hypothetical protein